MTFLTGINLPICFTKSDLALNGKEIAKTTLNGRIQRGIKQNKLLRLKNGLYIVNSKYIHESDKIHLAEYLASQMYQPSYVSLEYVLGKHDLLNKNDTSSLITSITTKSTHAFKNFVGTYRYSNIKPILFTGFEKYDFRGHTYYMATKGKALFDYLYLDSNLARRNDKRLRHQLFEESGIRWHNFSEEDFKEFDSYVWKTNSAKMEKIWHILNEHFEKKNFDVWAKKLLS